MQRPLRVVVGLHHEHIRTPLLRGPHDDAILDDLGAQGKTTLPSLRTSSISVVSTRSSGFGFDLITPRSARRSMFFWITSFEIQPGPFVFASPASISRFETS